MLDPATATALHDVSDMVERVLRANHEQPFPPSADELKRVLEAARAFQRAMHPLELAIVKRAAQFG